MLGKQTREADAVADVAHVAARSEVALILIGHRQIEGLTCIDCVQATDTPLCGHTIEALNDQHRVRHSQDRNRRDGESEASRQAHAEVLIRNQHRQPSSLRLGFQDVR